MEQSHQWPQFLAIISATILSVGNGIQLGWPSPSVPKLLSKDMNFDITETEVSYIVMISPLGYILGSPLCGFLLDKIGRKYTLLFLAPIQMLTWCTLALSKNVETIYCARVLMGITESGMFTALPPYIGEVMEPQVRGRAGTSISIGMLIGILFINVYGSYVSIRTAAYISLAAPILFLLTFMWMPESPYYLIAKGADHKARTALRTLRRMDNVETELSFIKKSVQRQMLEPGRFQDIFGVYSNFRAFIILATLRTVQQFCGVFTVGFYLQIIFKNAKAALAPHVSAIICNGVTAICTFGGSFFIDRFGRKVMITVSCIGCALSLLTLGTYFLCQRSGYDVQSYDWLPVVAMILYCIACSLGVTVVPTLMMSELLPSNIKAKALTVMNVYFGMCMSASSKLFQWTDSSYGPHVPFYIYTIVCVFGIIFTYFFVPETKGKTLEEIQEMLKRKNSTLPRKESNVLLDEYPKVKPESLDVRV